MAEIKGLAFEGPAMYIEPGTRDILQFARQLQDEVEAML